MTKLNKYPCQWLKKAYTGGVFHIKGWWMSFTKQANVTLYFDLDLRFAKINFGFESETCQGFGFEAESKGFGQLHFMWMWLDIK